MSLPVHPYHIMNDRIDLGQEREQFGSEMRKRPSLRMAGQYLLVAASCWRASEPPRRVMPHTHWVGMGWEPRYPAVPLIIDRCCLWTAAKRAPRQAGVCCHGIRTFMAHGAERMTF